MEAEIRSTEDQSSRVTPSLAKSIKEPGCTTNKDNVPCYQYGFVTQLSPVASKVLWRGYREDNDREECLQLSSRAEVAEVL